MNVPVNVRRCQELLGYCFQAELPLLTLRGELPLTKGRATILNLQVLARIDGKRFLMPALQRAGG